MAKGAEASELLGVVGLDGELGLAGVSEGAETELGIELREDSSGVKADVVEAVLAIDELDKREIDKWLLDMFEVKKLTVS